MQKPKLEDNATAGLEFQDSSTEAALDGTVVRASFLNDNFENLFNVVENAGYTLIDDDTTQLVKALKGPYNSTYTYNTDNIATQTVNDIVLGSDGYYYEVQDDSVTGDNPVGSVTGNWIKTSFDKLTRVWQEQTFPNWISDADGVGTPYEYDKYAIVRYTDGNNYVSTIDSNTGEPTIDSPDWTEFTAYLQSFGAEIATAAEIRTGTNNTKAVTPLGLNETTLGWGQTWTKFTTGVERVIGTTYTNNTGKPIQMGISVQTGTNHTVSFEINGEEVAGSTATTQAMSHNFNHIIEDGDTYEISAFTGSVVRFEWWELR